MPRRFKRGMKGHGRAGQGEAVDADVKGADVVNAPARDEDLEAGY